MSHKFVIQKSNPRHLCAHDPDDKTLSDAIQTVFPLETECAFLVWNHIYIPIGYKYDLSMMAGDIIDLIERMLDAERGMAVICWPSNTFSSEWRATWDFNEVVINAKWNHVVGGVTPLLEQRPSVSMSRLVFMAEWRGLLTTIESALSNAGYTTDQLPELLRLRGAIDRLHEEGVLYRTG
jgi:hypothetical protein